VVKPGLLLLGLLGGVAAAAPTLSVDVNAGRHPISEDIYGMNFASEALAQELKLPVDRWGGNATSRYNWQVNVGNAGSDYYFIIQDLGSPTTASADADAFVDQDRRTGSKSILTIPLIPYLTAGRPGVTAGVTAACSYSVGPFVATQFDSTISYGGSTCGNGSKASVPLGLLPSAQLTALNVANTPQSAKDWIAHLVGKYGSAGTGGVRFYMMDNEPSLWQDTHSDIYPVNQLSYTALRDVTQLYARAVKDADPSAQVLGPSDWGYSAYFDSPPGYALTTGGYAANGNAFFGVWYLQQMRAYEQANGIRLLDYFDEHYYPQAPGVTLVADDGNPATQALRLRSVRSLWDPTYTDESWIATVGGPFPAQVQLLPMFRSWVSANYPGTKVSVSEYNFGALDSINGALAEADVLGVFGREQLDLATLWGPPSATQPGAYAFRMYRNYDGVGSRFGDVSVQASSSDESQLSIYAAQRAGDGALTLMVLNKTAGALSAALTLSNFSTAAPASRFQYSPNRLGGIEVLAAVALSAGTLSATYPANSITLWVLAGPTADGGSPDGGGGDGGSVDGGAGPDGGGAGSSGNAGVSGSCATTAGAPFPLGVGVLLLGCLLLRRRA
jgi:hypothetical protein